MLFGLFRKLLLQGRVVLATAILTIVMVGAASALERLDDPPVVGGPAFTISQGGVEQAVDMADLCGLPQYQLRTDSPWEEGEQLFEGVLFRDALAYLGLDDAEAVIVRAFDEYSQRIPREDWDKYPLLLAMRENGSFLTRRNQGPTRLVYPVLDHPELDNPVHRNRWVWLIQSIERAE